MFTGINIQKLEVLFSHDGLLRPYKSLSFDWIKLIKSNSPNIEF